MNSLPETAPELKSVGLLFRAPLVRANLAGRKSVTRRNVSRTNSLVSFRGETPKQVSAEDWADLDWTQAIHNGESWQVCQRHQDMGQVMLPVYVYPRWQPGQILWQKETWLELRPGHWHDPYLSKGALIELGTPRRNAVAYRGETDADGESIREEYGYQWRSSMLMPRWASRFERPLASVTPTRLREITDADARREGIATGCVCTEERINWQCPEIAGPMGFDIPHVGPVDDFRRLFESIHGAGVWDANPCLWRVDYGTEGGAR